MDEKKNITTDTPPEEIEVDIARTRREISGSVGAIREKMSAEHFKEEAKEKIRHAPFVVQVKDAASRMGRQAKGTGYRVIDAVKRDPVPLAMIGAGIAWFIYSRSQHDGSSRAIAEGQAAIKSKASELAGKVQETAGELSYQTREKSSWLARRAKETAGDISVAARARAINARNSFQNIMEDNPFTITAAAFAIGVALGLLIPATRREKEMMGTASDRLLARAKATARETLYKAEHAAGKAFQTAKEEFR